MDKIISITSRDKVIYGKDCDGIYFIQPQFHTVRCWARTFLFYDEYFKAVAKIKKIVKPFCNDEKWSSLSSNECNEILNRMEIEFKEFLSA